MVLLVVLLPAFLSAPSLSAQDVPNAFLDDFEPRQAVVPPFVDQVPTASQPTVTVTVHASDTIATVSRYIFGHAHAVWVGNGIANPTVGRYLQQFSPSLLRYPGGSWGDIFFWDYIAPDLPDSLIDGTTGQTKLFYPQFGRGSWPTTLENYYWLREQANDAQGLITVNYGYARYGTGERPVEQAAHYAADWVRYDNGRTRFWEIGNENAGPWEAGWQIDTTQNQDGQPEIITGELYGRHFRVFADSMRAAAADIGATIYIGGQILHFDGANSWNVADRGWNEGFFREAGESPDFYVMHNYFGTQQNARTLLNVATTEPARNMGFIEQDFARWNAVPRPIALTEYNMGSAGALASSSFIKGMQAVILFSELIANGYSMSSRWLLATGHDGLFYDGNDPSIPLWNPRPTFFYLYYVPRFVGDNSVEAASSSPNVMAFASRFDSGHAGLILVNKGTSDEVVGVELADLLVGERLYAYSLEGGDDNGEFSQVVYVNGHGPSSPAAWGPIEEIEEIAAHAYPVSSDLRLELPGRSVQFVLFEPGEHAVAVEEPPPGPDADAGIGVYPNPASGSFHLKLRSGGYERIEMFDLLGRKVYVRTISRLETQLDVQPDLAAGVYIVRLQGPAHAVSVKMILRD